MNFEKGKIWVTIYNYHFYRVYKLLTFLLPIAKLVSHGTSINLYKYEHAQEGKEQVATHVAF